MLKMTKHILWGAALLLMASACTEEDYKLYDPTQKDSVFFEYRNNRNEITDTIDYAFNYDIATSHIVEIPVTLMGMPKDYERTISLIADHDSTTMKEGINYTITNNVIPANAVKGTIHVNLLRDLDPEIRIKSKKLMLTIGENDDLKSVGETRITIKYSDIRPTERPAWWLTFGPKPVYSYENVQLFFEYFYRLAPEASPEIFNEMIDGYGDYFVKATGVLGPFTLYEGFLRQYVLIPLYNDHPELEWIQSPLW